VARASEAALLRYYANSIAHLVPEVDGAPIGAIPVSVVVEAAR
jgi:hypothetical protein